MKILFVGDFGKDTDEGMRKISLMLTDGFDDDFEIEKVTTKEFGLFRKIKHIKNFSPTVIHYLTGPTIKSIVSTWLYKRLFLRQAIVIHSAIRPYFGPISRKFIKFFHPDYLLSQDAKWEKLFVDAGSKCIRFPNGVDCEKFKPVNEKEKKRLRRKYGFPENKKIVLHVGHIRSNRNLSIFTSLQKKSNFYVVIVGSKRFSKDKNLVKELENSGCRVITDYIERIEEIYQLADFYVFPVRALADNQFPKSYNQVGVIDFPLSILEAMACNLPVITTPFNAIKYFIGTDLEGLIYFDGTAKGLFTALGTVTKATKNRDIAKKFDIIKIRQRLKILYKKLGQRENENNISYWD